MHGHRGRKDDPLYRARRTLHTGTSLLTDKQIDRLISLFADDRHVEVEATWGIYQRMIAAYRDPDRGKGRQLMSALIESVSTGVPKALSEVITLGRNLKKRAADVLAYFDRPGTSNGPQRRSTAAWNTYAAPLSGAATSQTTSPDPYSRPAASEPDYTLDHEEPANMLTRSQPSGSCPCAERTRDVSQVNALGGLGQRAVQAGPRSRRTSDRCGIGGRGMVTPCEDSSFARSAGAPLARARLCPALGSMSGRLLPPGGHRVDTVCVICATEQPGVFADGRRGSGLDQ